MEAEEALKHGQRLEALGQLTGGVAHDFNNLLTVIRASADMLRRPHLTEERRQRYVEAISDTVDRAAKLTAQLLAFARRQTLKPELFDVGENVADVERNHPDLDRRADRDRHPRAGRTLPDQRRCRPVRDRADQHGGQCARRHGRRRPVDDRGSQRDGDAGARAAAAIAARLRCRCRSRIPASEFRKTSSGASSSRSSPPRRSARAPGSACRRCSVLPSNPAAR